MDGDEVLAHDRHGEDAGNHDRLRPDHGLCLGRFVFALAEPVDQPVGEKAGETGVGDCHGEGAEERIVQRDAGTRSQPFLKCDERPVEPEAGDEPARDGAQDEGKDYVHARQSKREHDDDGDEDGVHAADLMAT